eukprot:Blabericola_migrator_1__3470@NODE_2026_length_3392_cov_191_048421_g1287_i0_p1_GENE_NODE_2026_length_3392_cov_191_048421_g1287_i0NODE_2026_length_3392_cov_191_048421_g1287_i0_p1_ORF_typecomplete_len173_score11_80_NODE_2026_length_3392_cov_191_048421_g1287_i020822600
MSITPTPLNFEPLALPPVTPITPPPLPSDLPELLDHPNHWTSFITHTVPYGTQNTYHSLSSTADLAPVAKSQRPGYPITCTPHTPSLPFQAVLTNHLHSSSGYGPFVPKPSGLALASLRWRTHLDVSLSSHHSLLTPHQTFSCPAQFLVTYTVTLAPTPFISHIIPSQTRRS